MEDGMADDRDRTTHGILGDIDPVPAARDHMGGDSGVNEEDDAEQAGQRPGARDVTDTTSGAGTEVGGTRNYRTGTGYTGVDIGKRPE
jgi:hypothetical protein